MTKKILLFFVLFVAGAIAVQFVSANRVDRLRQEAGEAFNQHDFVKSEELFKQLQPLVSDPIQVQMIQQRIDDCRKEQIRAAMPQIVSLQASQPAASPPATAAAPQPAAEPVINLTRKPHAPPQPGEVRFMNVRQLGNFDYNPDAGLNLPDDVKALDGMQVKLIGYMIPLNQSGQVTDFALVPTLGMCCFGQPPQVQHTVIVHCAKDHPATFSQELIAVQGTLRVAEKKQDGYTISLYEVDAVAVKRF